MKTNFWKRYSSGFEALRERSRRFGSWSGENPEKTDQKTDIRDLSNEAIIEHLNREIENGKELRWALQISETRFRRLFETAQDGILILDANTGNINEVNKFLINMLGYSREEFLGKKLWEMGAFIDIERSKSAFKELQGKGYIRYEDLPLRTKDGRMINVEFISNVYSANRVRVIQCNIRDITERKEEETKLKIKSSHDQLTGCLNYRSIMELLENEIARSRRYQKKFSLAMMDIDDFKDKNDRYGHQAGNEVLVSFSDVVKKSLRGIDSLGRYGGEEFVVIFPEVGARDAVVALDRIRNIVRKTKITSPCPDNAEAIKLRFSAGIAEFPKDAETANDLIRSADDALLRAKREGKDRTDIYATDKSEGKAGTKRIRSPRSNEFSHPSQ
jgi:diguanylate cyclase (GGDEF)-like protein/PAS domain S-box-containing protein